MLNNKIGGLELDSVKKARRAALRLKVKLEEAEALFGSVPDQAHGYKSVGRPRKKSSDRISEASMAYAAAAEKMRRVEADAGVDMIDLEEMKQFGVCTGINAGRPKRSFLQGLDKNRRRLEREANRLMKEWSPWDLSMIDMIERDEEREEKRKKCNLGRPAYSIARRLEDINADIAEIQSRSECVEQSMPPLEREDRELEKLRDQCAAERSAVRACENAAKYYSGELKASKTDGEKAYFSGLISSCLSRAASAERRCEEHYLPAIEKAAASLSANLLDSLRGSTELPETKYATGRLVESERQRIRDERHLLEADRKTSLLLEPLAQGAA